MSTSKTIQLSPGKYKALKNQLEEMKTIGRKLLADKLDQYRSESNPDDPAAYNEVLEEKDSLEREIAEIESTLENADVVEEQCSGGEIGAGCTVKLESLGREVEFDIVSSVESDPEKRKISDESPLGSALKGKKSGDTVEIKTPNGLTAKYKVLSVK